MRLILAACLALLATPVLAQSDTATPQQIAAARAQADRLIQRANAQDWFENVTDSALPAVRHRPSGMRCLFVGNQYDQIAVFPTAQGGIPAGYDVGCVSREESLGVDLTLYATRYRPLPTEQQIMGAAAQAVVSRYPGARPYGGDVALASAEGRPEPLSRAWTIEGDRFTLAMVSHNREWGFKARANGDDPSMTSLYASVAFVAALADVGGWPD